MRFTQTGSVPIDDPKEAMVYSLKHDIPFLPELPGDEVTNYLQNPGKLRALDEFNRYYYDTVKIQSVGPATAIIMGLSEDEAMDKVYNHIDKIMDGLIANEVILYLDEPGLRHCGFDYKPMWDALFSSFDVTPGVHTCDIMDWDQLFDSNIKIISFDASKFDITIAPKYRRDKIISWGVERLEDVRDYQTGDLLTLPCGMRTYPVDQCEPALEKLIYISRQFRN